MVDDATPVPDTALESDGWDWAVVEIFGHRRHAGRTREVEQFGAKFIRIDVPNQGDPAAHGWTSHLYSGGALFSVSPSDEATCLRLNKPYPKPSRYALPAPDDDHQEEVDDVGV